MDFACLGSGRYLSNRAPTKQQKKRMLPDFRNNKMLFRSQPFQIFFEHCLEDGRGLYSFSILVTFQVPFCTCFKKLAIMFDTFVWGAGRLIDLKLTILDFHDLLLCYIPGNCAVVSCSSLTYVQHVSFQMSSDGACTL